MMSSVIKCTLFALRSEPTRTEERENGNPEKESKSYFLYL